MTIHKPVLPEEVLKYLDPKPNENFVDCTAGEGGHSKLILEKTGPEGKLLAIEWDNVQAESCKKNLSEFDARPIVVNDNYANLENIIKENNFGQADGVLLDIGFSSFQIEGSQKGFSFLKNEILDMRYSQKSELTAQKIVNQWPENEISKLLQDYGEEKFAKQIAKAVVQQRRVKQIKTTFELVEIIKKATPEKFCHGKIHCATRTFQALRIVANNELGNLQKVLPQAISVLKSKGRLAVISFHSLEDRIVKNFLKHQEGCLSVLTKKPVEANDREILENPRSRSAKLRVAIKL